MFFCIIHKILQKPLICTLVLKINTTGKNHGNLATGKKLFPNLEKSWNWKKVPKTWKNHGIWKMLYGYYAVPCFNSRRFPSCPVPKFWGELQHFWSASYLPCIIGTFWKSKNSLNRQDSSLSRQNSSSRIMLWAPRTIQEFNRKTFRGYGHARNKWI